MTRVMSDTELRHRKKLQGTISRTTSTLGLGALGLTAAAGVAAKKPGLLRKFPSVTPHKLKNAAINTGLVSGGIGGVGGYNFAAYTNAESKKRKTPMVKNDGIEMGYYGEEGHQIKLPKITVPVDEINKAWSPVAEPFDSEARRHKRGKLYQRGLETTSAGAAGAATYEGVKGGLKVAENLKPNQVRASHLPNVKAAQAVRRASAVKSGKVAAGLAGASLTAGAGAGLIRRKRQGDWQSYSKRDDLSAFGISHDSDSPIPESEPLNGQHRETEN